MLFIPILISLFGISFGVRPKSISVRVTENEVDNYFKSMRYNSTASCVHYMAEEAAVKQLSFYKDYIRCLGDNNVVWSCNLRPATTGPEANYRDDGACFNYHAKHDFTSTKIDMISTSKYSEKLSSQIGFFYGREGDPNAECQYLDYNANVIHCFYAATYWAVWTRQFISPPGTEFKWGVNKEFVWDYIDLHQDNLPDKYRTATRKEFIDNYEYRINGFQYKTTEIYEQPDKNFLHCDMMGYTGSDDVQELPGIYFHCQIFIDNSKKKCKNIKHIEIGYLTSNVINDDGTSGLDSDGKPIPSVVNKRNHYDSSPKYDPFISPTYQTTKHTVNPVPYDIAHTHVIFNKRVLIQVETKDVLQDQGHRNFKIKWIHQLMSTDCVIAGFIYDNMLKTTHFSTDIHVQQFAWSANLGVRAWDDREFDFSKPPRVQSKITRGLVYSHTSLIYRTSKPDIKTPSPTILPKFYYWEDEVNMAKDDFSKINDYDAFPELNIVNDLTTLDMTVKYYVRNGLKFFIRLAFLATFPYQKTPDVDIPICEKNFNKVIYYKSEIIDSYAVQIDYKSFCENEDKNISSYLYVSNKEFVKEVSIYSYGVNEDNKHDNDLKWKKELNKKGLGYLANRAYGKERSACMFGITNSHSNYFEYTKPTTSEWTKFTYQQAENFGLELTKECIKIRDYNRLNFSKLSIRYTDGKRSSNEIFLFKVSEYPVTQNIIPYSNLNPKLDFQNEMIPLQKTLFSHKKKGSELISRTFVIYDEDNIVKRGNDIFDTKQDSFDKWTLAYSVSDDDFDTIMLDSKFNKYALDKNPMIVIDQTFDFKINMYKIDTSRFLKEGFEDAGPMISNKDQILDQSPWIEFTGASTGPSSVRPDRITRTETFVCDKTEVWGDDVDSIINCNGSFMAVSKDEYDITTTYASVNSLSAVKVSCTNDGSCLSNYENNFDIEITDLVPIKIRIKLIKEINKQELSFDLEFKTKNPNSKIQRVIDTKIPVSIRYSKYFTKDGSPRVSQYNQDSFDNYKNDFFKKPSHTGLIEYYQRRADEYFHLYFNNEIRMDKIAYIKYKIDGKEMINFTDTTLVNEMEKWQNYPANNYSIRIDSEHHFIEINTPVDMKFGVEFIMKDLKTYNYPEVDLHITNTTSASLIRAKLFEPEVEYWSTTMRCTRFVIGQGNNTINFTCTPNGINSRNEKFNYELEVFKQSSKESTDLTKIEFESSWNGENGELFVNIYNDFFSVIDSDCYLLLNLKLNGIGKLKSYRIARTWKVVFMPDCKDQALINDLLTREIQTEDQIGKSKYGSDVDSVDPRGSCLMVKPPIYKTVDQVFNLKYSWYLGNFTNSDKLDGIEVFDTLTSPIPYLLYAWISVDGFLLILLIFIITSIFIPRE